MPVRSSAAEPFAHDGTSGTGVLLCHGFTSTPQSMRDWAEHLAAADLTVRCPLLPGHGTSWRDLNRTKWTDWYAAVARSLDELRSSCRSVFVFGQSMGGTLTLRLAEQNPDIAGIVLVNPSVTTLRRGAALLPVLCRVLPRLPGIPGDIAKPGSEEIAYRWLPLKAMASLQQLWKIVRQDLYRIEQPVLLFRSAVDHIVEPVNSEIVLTGVRSTDSAEVVLPNSYHVATLDHDAPEIFRLSAEFIQRVLQRTAEETA